MINFFRYLPAFRGKRRLARFLFPNQFQQEGDMIVMGKHNIQYCLPNIRENVGMDIYVNGIYEPEVVNFLKSELPQNGVYFDLGANIGSILIPLCKLRKDVLGVGVEASPWVFNYLKRNCELNEMANVRILNNALYDKDDELLDFYSPRDKYGKGSFSSLFSTDAVKVVTRRVDTLMSMLNIQNVDIIKIDVEGYECLVFKGAQKLLQHSAAPDIIFEFVDWAESQALGLKAGDAQQFLLDLGYDLFIIDREGIKKSNSILYQGAYNLLASKRNRRPKRYD